MRNVCTFDVFISGPADVQDELDHVRDVVNGWNSRFADRNVTFRPFVWSEDVTPQIGVDPQTVINAQLPDFDVFIGVLWSRVGRQTPRAASGTIEEYNIALRKHSVNPKVRVALYFKDAAIPQDRIDADQWRALSQFKAEVSSTQFYKSFSTSTALAASVERLLDSVARMDNESTAQSLMLSVNDSENVPSTSKAVALVVIEEVGFFEANDQFNVTMSELTGIARAIGEMLESLNVVTRSASAKLTFLNFSGSSSLSERKPIIDELADEMSALSAKLQADIPRYEVVKQKVGNHLATFIDLMSDVRTAASDGTEFRDALRAATKAIEGAMITLREMRSTLEGVPRLTTRFRKSRAELINLISTIDRFHSDLIETFNTASVQLHILINRPLPIDD